MLQLARITLIKGKSKYISYPTKTLEKFIRKFLKKQKKDPKIGSCFGLTQKKCLLVST